MNRTPLVLVTEPIASRGLRLLAASCEVRAPWSEGRIFDENDLRDADALIVRLVPVTATLLEKAPNLRVIGRHGVGLDSVDLAAATSRGIPVVYTPGSNSNAVAEHAFHLMLSLCRHTLAAHRAVRESAIPSPDLVGSELRSRILGIVGIGAIGTRVARIAHHGFGMTVIGYDPLINPSASPSFVKRTSSLRELLEQADIVTLHAPLTPLTRHMINSESLAWMKPSALLINTARGAEVDSHALATALQTRQIAGAALDVFENEPLPAENPLQSAPRILFSPHIGGSTLEARDATAEIVVRQVVEVLKGDRPEFLANPDVMVAWRRGGGPV